MQLARFKASDLLGCAAVQKEAPLLVPDVLVCSVGTEIFFESAGEADKEWGAELDQGWNRQGALDIAAGFPELKQQVRLQYNDSRCSDNSDMEFGAERDQGWDWQGAAGRRRCLSRAQTAGGAPNTKVTPHAKAFRMTNNVWAAAGLDRRSNLDAQMSPPGSESRQAYDHPCYLVRTQVPELHVHEEARDAEPDQGWHMQGMRDVSVEASAFTVPARL